MTNGVGRLTCLVLVAMVATACNAFAAPSPTPEVTEEASVPPPPGKAQVVACLSINPVECSAVADQVVTLLPAADGSPFSIQVHLSSCLDDAEACPESLAVRSGRVLVEYPDGGDALLFSVAGPPGAPAIEPIDDVVWTEPVQPGSPRAENAGPFEFEVGHCGLLHVVDFDGSFWVLVGQVDGSHQAILNSEKGAISLLGPGSARYVGSQSEVFTLARFPGAKRFQLCD